MNKLNDFLNESFNDHKRLSSDIAIDKILLNKE